MFIQKYVFSLKRTTTEKTESDKNEVKVAGLVIAWYQRCSVDLLHSFGVLSSGVKVEGSKSRKKRIRITCAQFSRVNTAATLITVCEYDSYCLAGGTVLLICGVMHTVGTRLLSVDVRSSLQYCVAPHEKIAASRATRM